ncbi:MAG: hypothetical protein JSS11_03095 [Verrucomicrobia bacterium]|nr:hypothetical protein [Verrucomicrobiota bacterium]
MSMPPPLRRVLIVSPHFPPVNAPDLQRVRMSLPHYRAAGWEPIVLCVGDAWQEGTREPELERTLPDDIMIIRCPAFPRRWTRWLGVGNLGLRCWLHFLLIGSRLIRREKIDLVFFSNTQFVTFTLGRIWRAWHGVPYVLDMQDPWRTDYYSRAGSRRPPGGWKYHFARLSAWLLEGWSFGRVSGVMSVSPDYIADLRDRYRHLAIVPAATIRFGASRRDLADAMALPPSTHSYSRRPGEIHVLYTGAAGPVTPHAVTVLFTGLQRYRAAHPERAARFRFHFYGTSYVGPGEGKNAVLPLAEALGVGDLVDEIPHRLGHLECLQLQREADILLLPGSSDLAYSPSKIYPYYIAERPILGVVFRHSVLEKILFDLQCAVMVPFGENESPDQACALLADFFDAAIAGFPPGLLPARRDDYFSTHFLAESLTHAQGRLFDAALRHGSPPPCPAL